MLPKQSPLGDSHWHSLLDIGSEHAESGSAPYRESYFIRLSTLTLSREWYLKKSSGHNLCWRFGLGSLEKHAFPFACIFFSPLHRHSRFQNVLSLHLQTSFVSSLRTCNFKTAPHPLAGKVSHFTTL